MYELVVIHPQTSEVVFTIHYKSLYEANEALSYYNTRSRKGDDNVIMPKDKYGCHSIVPTNLPYFIKTLKAS